MSLALSLDVSLYASLSSLAYGALAHDGLVIFHGLIFGPLSHSNSTLVKALAYQVALSWLL